MAENATLEFESPIQTEIRVEGGDVTFHNVNLRTGPAMVVVSSDGKFDWTQGAIDFDEWIVESGTVSLEEVQLRSVEAKPLVARQGHVRVANSSVEGVGFTAGAGATIRLLNIAVQLADLGGDGMIQREWSASASVVKLDGSPVPGRSVVATSIVASAGRVTAATGQDGRAYLEIKEYVVVGGTPRLETPHRFSTVRSESVAAVTGPNHEVVLVEPQVR